MFMTARGCLIELSNITKALNRDTPSRLPPALGCGGYHDYIRRVELWKRWIQWEQGYPLILAKEDTPEMWFSAAEWRFAYGTDNQGVDFLDQGIVETPESCLLHFKYAERLEATTLIEGTEELLILKGQLPGQLSDTLLNGLCELVQIIHLTEKEDLMRIADTFVITNPHNAEDGGKDDDPVMAATMPDNDAQVATLWKGTKGQLHVITENISAVWINLMRAMRRVQGHGKVNKPLGGSHRIFPEARRRGKINSDVYISCAQIEYQCYKHPARLKILERGMRIFPEDRNFVLEYLKFIVDINDITNARAVVEAFLGRVTAEKARMVYEFFYNNPAHNGEPGQDYKMEKRMRELYLSGLGNFQ
ncbi:putative mRNA 3'-end-processing protein rna14 [Tuber indicum]|nr:putative mRNA 3'-end-processing protein rna14 [Tuber indicum]